MFGIIILYIARPTASAARSRPRQFASSPPAAPTASESILNLSLCVATSTRCRQGRPGLAARPSCSRD